jgi:hypothetical protein
VSKGRRRGRRASRDDRPGTCRRSDSAVDGSYRGASLRNDEKLTGLDLALPRRACTAVATAARSTVQMSSTSCGSSSGGKRVGPAAPTEPSRTEECPLSKRCRS